MIVKAHKGAMVFTIVRISNPHVRFADRVALSFCAPRVLRVLRSFFAVRGYRVLPAGPLIENTRFFGDGPNDAQVTTGTWFTPGFDQSHTPPAKIAFSRASSAARNGAA